MANIFSSNQVNHVYVVNAYQASTVSNEGDIKAAKKGNALYFTYKGKGGIERTDLIENIMDVRSTVAPVELFIKPNTASIGVNSNAVSGGAPIVGQDYILRVEFMNPIGISMENKYWKEAVAHCTGETKSNLLLKLAKSLAMSFARDAQPLLKIYVACNSDGSGSSTSAKKEVTRYSNIADTTTAFPGTYTHILLEEVEQPWYLGTKQQKPIIFNVTTSVINTGTTTAPVMVYWGDVIYSNGKKLVGGGEPTYEIVTSGMYVATPRSNSKLAADLEYFSMGERGDVYRMTGWPNTIHTDYMVDPNNAYGYDAINIHYAYTGSNHAMQKSEKDITFLCKRVSSDNDTTDELKALGACGAALWSAIQALINPADDRYLTTAKLFTDDTYTNGHNAIIAKAANGTVSIEDGGAIG